LHHRPSRAPGIAEYFFRNLLTALRKGVSCATFATDGEDKTEHTMTLRIPHIADLRLPKPENFGADACAPANYRRALDGVIPD
jgi:hypothetical protein